MFLLNGINVHSTNRQAIKILLSRLKSDARLSREHREERHALIQKMLQEHKEHKNLVAEFRL